MPDDPRVQQLLEDLIESGSSPERVCRDCPELQSQVRERWDRVRQVRACLDDLFPGPISDFHTAEIRPSPPASGDLPQIPGYEVREILGWGGMGVVYKALHLRLNRVVALKMLLAGAHASPTDLERFLRESKAVAGLRHPNIVQVYDADGDHGQPFFTLEFVEGGSLAQKLNGTPQPARQAAEMVMTLARAVAVAHRGGILHRDLKPANVLLTPDGTPKISDFGLARRLEGGEGLTLSGATVGTPGYMAPEQANGETRTLGTAVDIYALGAILYEMQTGRPPFRAETAAATLRQVIAQEPVPPTRLNPAMPRDLETICLKCLQKEPHRRYASAESLADDLHRFLEGRPILARATGGPEHAWRWCRRHPREAAIAGLAMLLVLSAGGIAWRSGRQNVERRIERAREEGRARHAVELLLEQAKSLRGLARWPEAVNSLQQAAEIVREQGVEDQRGRVERAMRDVRMAKELDRNRQATERIVGQEHRTASVCDDYRREFRDYGLPVAEASAAESADRIRRSEIRQDLIDALDDWAFREPDEAIQTRLAAILRLVDPDPWRGPGPRPGEPRRSASVGAIGRLRPPAGTIGAGPDRPFQPALVQRPGLEIPAVRGLDQGGVADRGRSQGEGPGGPVLAASAAGPSRQFLDQLQPGQGDREDEPGGVDRLLPGRARVAPRATAAHSSLAMVLAQEGRQDEAIQQLRLATGIDPGEAEILRQLGTALDRSGRRDEAIDSFRRSLEIAPDSAAAHCELGRLLADGDRTDEAIEHFRRACKLAPESAASFCNLGLALEKKGRLDEAVDRFEQALRVEPDNASTHNLLAQALFLQGKAEPGIGHLRRALQLDPARPAVHNDLGVALQSRGRPDEAIDQYQQALKIDDGDAQAHNNLGVALAGKGRVDEAIGHYRRALQINPRYAHAHANLGRALQSRCLAEEAIRHFEQALQIDPKQARVLLALGRSFQSASRFAEAKAAILRCLELAPQGDPLHAGALQQLRACERWIALEARLPAVLGGTCKPADADESLQLAELCRMKKLFAPAIPLYAAAFADSTALAEDMRSSNRYNAACAAALAGASKGEPEPLRWRDQARRWLRADLSSWARRLDDGEPASRAIVQRTLTHWLSDPDLASLRETTSPEDRSADERREDLLLWKEVGLVLDRTR